MARSPVATVSAAGTKGDEQLKGQLFPVGGAQRATPPLLLPPRLVARLLEDVLPLVGPPLLPPDDAMPDEDPPAVVTLPELELELLVPPVLAAPAWQKPSGPQAKPAGQGQPSSSAK